MAARHHNQFIREVVLRRWRTACAGLGALLIGVGFVALLCGCDFNVLGSDPPTRTPLPVPLLGTRWAVVLIQEAPRPDTLGFWLEITTRGPVDVPEFLRCCELRWEGTYRFTRRANLGRGTAFFGLARGNTLSFRLVALDFDPRAEPPVLVGRTLDFRLTARFGATDGTLKWYEGPYRQVNLEAVPDVWAGTARAVPASPIAGPRKSPGSPPQEPRK